MAGCPELVPGALRWSHEVCTWSFHDYRALQEQAYVNHAGVPMESIYVLMTAFPAILVTHHSCGPSAGSNVPWQMALLDACVVALPLTFHFSAHMKQPVLLLAASILELRRCFKGSISWQDRSFTLESGTRLRFVSEYRALVMMSTCVAILAVDFSSLFPREHAKTEEFGYSLMDVGTGSIIFSSAVTVPRRGGRVLAKLLKLWPVLLIGFIRAALMWGIDYHVPAGEYGVHWNFFFTIAVVSLVSVATDLNPGAASVAAAVLIGSYEFYLTWLGGADFVLHAERVDLFSANREGILSCAGYLSLHWMGVAVGSMLRHSQAWHCVLKLFLLAAAGYCMNLLLSAMGLEASRRMCNLPYTSFILSLNCWVLGLLGMVDLLAGRPRPAMSLSIAGVSDSMLPIFLYANLLTGAANLCLQPLMVPFWPALAVMLGYSLLWSFPAAMLRLKQKKLKFW